MKTKSILVAAALIVASQLAAAYTITKGGTVVVGEGLYTSVAGAVTTNFNNGLLPANYAGGGVKTGSVGGQWASPPNDTSAYYSVGPSTSSPGVRSNLALSDYFGFYMGSPDTYNSVQIYRNNTLLDTITGLMMASAPPPVAADGNQSVGFYINIFAANAGEYFDAVNFISSSNAFETDNHAVRAVSQVPEPASLALFGIGLVGLAAARRKK